MKSFKKLTPQAVAALLAAAAIVGLRPPAAASASGTRAPEAESVPIADSGSIRGTATFSSPRPKQPIIAWLQRDGGEAPFSPPAPLTIRQRGARFDPSFAVVVTGQDVVFENDEDREIDHNVYSLGAEEINLGIFPPKKSRVHTFSTPGEVSLYCSVHKLMDGKLFVAPSPAFAEIGEDGSFSIAGVPAGTYTLRTWQKARRFRDVETRVTVSAGAETAVAVEMKR